MLVKCIMKGNINVLFLFFYLQVGYIYIYIDELKDVMFEWKFFLYVEVLIIKWVR